jgi:hypothetical protein
MKILIKIRHKCRKWLNPEAEDGPAKNEIGLVQKPVTGARPQ